MAVKTLHKLKNGRQALHGIAPPLEQVSSLTDYPLLSLLFICS